MIRTCAVMATCVVALATSTVRAEDGCQDLTLHTTETLTAYDFDTSSAAVMAVLDPAASYRIGEVRIVRQTIFDPTNPAEDHWLYRAADRAHVDTSESAIRDVILFAEDERITPATLVESERNLRAKPYLYDARVLPRRLCGDRLDVDVVTRDVWTLNPTSDVTREGGDNSFSVGLEDVNLLGRGKQASIGYSSNENRAGIGVSYFDPNLAHTRVALVAFAADNDDGSHQYLDIGQPFYSRDTRYALGGQLDLLEQEESLYFRGDEVSKFRRELESYGVRGGLLAGRGKGGIWRLTAGYRYEENLFSPVPGEIAPEPLPTDRTLAYPWLGFEYLEDRFETAVNVDRIERTEDLFVGRRVYGEFGYSNEAFGADQDSRAVVRLGFEDAYRPSGRHLLNYGATLKGLWNFTRDEEEDTVLAATFSYRHQQGNRFSFAASGRGEYARNLFEDHQLLLGGDSGLRGYPSRYQTGDRDLIVSFEERYYADTYLLRLVRVGFVTFVDVGRAWFPGDPDSRDGFGLLADAGFGFRFDSPRLRRDRILHVDFGFPLVDGPKVDAVQVSFTVKSQL